MSQECLVELVKAKVSPADRPYDEGIQLENGLTLPFLIERSWLGPAGNYWEEWSIRRGGREILFTNPPKQIFVKGMQTIRAYTDRVEQRIALEPGEYNLVFVVEGFFMGAVPVKVSQASSEAA